MRIATFTGLAAALAAPLALAACVDPQQPLAPDFAVSLRQDITAQIADPDARYERQAPPAASGARAALAQQRYNKGTVTAPASQGTTSMRSQGGGGQPGGN